MYRIYADPVSMPHNLPGQILFRCLLSPSFVVDVGQMKTLTCPEYHGSPLKQDKVHQKAAIMCHTRSEHTSHVMSYVFYLLKFQNLLLDCKSIMWSIPFENCQLYPYSKEFRVSFLFLVKFELPIRYCSITIIFMIFHLFFIYFMTYQAWNMKL